MPTVVDYYHYLHRYPEIALKETVTSAYIEQSLKDMGYSPKRYGETGVAADLVTDPALPWVILRADMDALPIVENSCVAMPSENPGMMHACGHDSHVAMLLGAAQELYGKKLPRNIRFVFQPGEEGTAGALVIINDGVIPENACACFAVHVWPGVPKGQLATRPGGLMAAADRMRLIIHGRSAHCGQQHLGADALRAAAEIVGKLPEVRALAEDQRTVLFCGSFHSGTSHNIVPDLAELHGTLRTYLPADQKLVKEKLAEMASAVAAKYGATAELRWESSSPAVINDAALVETLGTMIDDYCSDVEASLTGEDFSRYQEKMPGVMLWLGTGDTPPLHTPEFYVPEEILPIGVNFWVKVANHPW